MTEFTQENIENFLVDKSFSLLKKIEQLYEPYQIDEKGKYLDFDEGLDRVHSEASDMIKQIINGHLLSSEPDWKQATVLYRYLNFFMIQKKMQSMYTKEEIWLFQDLFVRKSVFLLQRLWSKRQL